MSKYVLTEIRQGFYLDSVALMRMSREITAMEGILEAALMMGSPTNIAIMQDAGLLAENFTVRSNDLVMVLKARTEPQANAALAAASKILDRSRESNSSGSETRNPRSIAAAVREVPEANLALVSVPGDFATAEARKALRRGLNVLMFSNNVALEDELALKREARDLDLLMMGPDCGTAIINGAPLAFANVVNRGTIGVIGASGTGTQEVTSLISESGQGISHAIGVGGRDLKKDIGGITTLMAMDALDNDEGTHSVVLISKPPHPDVAIQIIARIAISPKLYTVCFLGSGPLDLPKNAHQAYTLREAAELALDGGAIGAGFDMAQAVSALKVKAGKGSQIRGLFCGGTLCAEAQVVLGTGSRYVASNAPIPGVPNINEDDDLNIDKLIDLGADEYTQGRPHPMIDPSLRDDMLLDAMGDDTVAVILIDLVIGYGAHADPATNLSELLTENGGCGVPIVASVTGTENDPQHLSRQVATLKNAGIEVAPSNADACELALAFVTG
jgi:FdrA protein